MTTISIPYSAGAKCMSVSFASCEGAANACGFMSNLLCSVSRGNPLGLTKDAIATLEAEVDCLRQIIV
jgi:hypothetical protein